MSFDKGEVQVEVRNVWNNQEGVAIDKFNSYACDHNLKPSLSLVISLEESRSKR